jgi:hypothetical protein
VLAIVASRLRPNGQVVAQTDYSDSVNHFLWRTTRKIRRDQGDGVPVSDPPLRDFVREDFGASGARMRVIPQIQYQYPHDVSRFELDPQQHDFPSRWCVTY